MFWQQLLTIALIHLLAVMSPGPDFVLITRNSFKFSKKIGLFTALGLALGILVHVFYSLVGIGLVISKSVVLFSLIKFVGAGYLIYVGYKSLKSSKKANKTDFITKEQHLSKSQAIKMGFFTNVTNPKVTIFFLSLFTQVIEPSTPLVHQIIFGLEMSVATFLWFSLVAYLFSNNLLKSKFQSIQHHVERVMGVILIGFGLKLITSSNK